MRMVTLHRIQILVLAIATSACASAGAYSPRAFPTAPLPAASASPGPAAPLPPVDATAAASPAVFTTPPADRSVLAADILSTALGLRGIPYRLGGSDLSGFDCSGFVQYVLARHSIAMPRTVAEQFGVGQRSRDVEAGDLVFFQTLGASASHVGIAVDAHSFVHAPNSRGVVRIDRLDAPYWSDRFVGARRVY